MGIVKKIIYAYAYGSTMDIFAITKNQSAILVKLLYGPTKMKDLRDVVRNYTTLQKEIYQLQSMGYITLTEKIEGRRTVYVELTEEGKYVASRLIDIALSTDKEGIVSRLNLFPLFSTVMSSIKYRVSFSKKRLPDGVFLRFRLVVPTGVKFEEKGDTRDVVMDIEKVNVDLVDITTLSEEKIKAKKIPNDKDINERRVTLYCRKCESNKCEHVNALWANPTAREFILEEVRNNHLSLVQ